jgi:hypothetical protein
MRRITLRFLSVAVPFLGILSLRAAEPIKHRFMFYDESRAILHYVDENDATKNWDLPLPRALRDFQLIGNNRVIVAQGFGYSIYDIVTRKLVEDVKVPGLGGGITVHRRADGTTVLGANEKDGVTVVELDKTNAVTRKMTVPGLKTLRMLRLTPDGNILLAEESTMTEVVFDKDSPGGAKIVKSIKLPTGRNAYMALKKPDGSYLLAGGFAKTLFDFGPDGKLRRQYTVKDPPAGVEFLFYAGFQVLKNGNIVVCNWTGHGAQDSTKGWQLVEFSPDGAVVWHWHDPKIGGTATNITILDDQDANAYWDESDGVLKPAPAK